jgi:SAM-dependent methyltransferase
MHAQEALKRFIAEGPRNVLDVGAGAGLHAAEMRRAGLPVTTVDIAGAQDIVGDYLEVPLNRQYSAIWCSHVLEHIRNPGQFLNKVFQDLEPGGLLSITVPPMRTKLVGGHINQFTPASLVYQLVLAGFDCSQARVGVYGYNVSVLVRKRAAQLPALVDDCGDIERLAAFFPWPVRQGVDGLGSVNW